MTNRPLRVLYLVPDLGVGGAERHVATLMPMLDPTRFEPSVICLGAEGDLFGGLTEAGVPALALGRTKRQAAQAVIELLREMRRIAPDIVITRGYNAELLGRIAAIVLRVPRRVVWVHNCGDIEPRGRIRRWADRLLDPFTHAYFGVAEAQREYLTSELRYPAAKIRIIRNGVDPTGFGHSDGDGHRAAVADLGIGEADLVVGIVAALRPEKDHALALRAMRRVIDRMPAAKLLVIGDGPLRASLERQAAELGVAEHVVWAGSRLDVARLLRAVDVFLLCSHSVECFPMALLEAMAAGRPAVCTAVGGVPELLVDGVTGTLVPPRDEVALADALVTMLADGSGRWAMGVAARERVTADFTLRASVIKTETALRALAYRPCPPQRHGPLRLAVIVDAMAVGGVEMVLLNMFRAFDPEVVQPQLICLREPGPMAADFESAGFTVTVLPRSGRYDLRTVPRLASLLRRNGVHAVLVPHHQRAALLFGPLAARLAGIRARLVAAHDMDMTAVGGRVFPRWAVAAMPVSNALVLLSPSQGEYLRREEGVGSRAWHTVREVVIPNGVSVSGGSLAPSGSLRAELGLGATDIVVGIVARLVPQKAHEVLFRAMARLVETRPELRLLVVGAGPRDGELRALAAELGIASRTVFTGLRRDVPAIARAIDVLCLSSVHEGAPLVVMEAMSLGTPVVATACGSLTDLVIDGTDGYLVPVGDDVALADRLSRLVDDEELRATMARAAHQKAQRDFTIERTAARYERLLTELAGR